MKLSPTQIVCFFLPEDTRRLVQEAFAPSDPIFSENPELLASLQPSLVIVPVEKLPLVNLSSTTCPVLILGRVPQLAKCLPEVRPSTHLMTVSLGKATLREFAEDIFDETKLKACNESFVRISLEEFLLHDTVNCDLFFKHDGRLIRVRCSGEHIGVEEASELRELGLQSVHIRKKDYKAFLLIPPEFSTCTDFHYERKRRIFEQVAVVAKEVSGTYSELNPRAFSHARMVMESALSVLLDNEMLLGEIEKLFRYREEESRMFYLVGIFSVLICQYLDGAGTRKYFLAAASGFLHDIGNFPLPEELKNSSSSKEIEKALYESHPERGSRFLKKVLGISPEIVNIVLQHHEKGDGSGFPLGLVSVEIHPLARVVCLVDGFFHQLKFLPTTPGWFLSEAKSYVKNVIRVDDPYVIEAFMLVFAEAVPSEIVENQLEGRLYPGAK